ncbi:MAG: TonB-dependent receptor [Glaciecola sp.]
MSLKHLPEQKLTRSKLSTAISIALFPFLFASPLAISQEQAAAETVAEKKVTTEDDIEIIEVSGFRSSATRQLNNKRFAKNISDSIFAEDMGKMPDANIAEAMQRITGIGIDRVDGEGTEITIRGVEGSLNNVQMNGVTLTNSGDDNSVDFSSMSADMLRSIEVIKSPSANHDEGSLGGTVRLNTWKPLDIKKKRTVVSLKGVYNDLSGEYNPTVGVSFGNNFSDVFGATASVNYSKNTTRQDRLTNYRWQYRNAPNAVSAQTGEALVNENGGQYRVFDAFGYEKNLSTIETENLSLATSLQYKINDDASVWVDLTHSTREKQKTQYNQTISHLFLNSSENVVDEEARTSVSITAPKTRARVVAFDQPLDTETTTLGLNYQHVLFDGKWTLDAKFGYSGSTSYMPIEQSRRLIFNSGGSNANTQAATINWLNESGNTLLAPEYTVDGVDGGTFPAANIPVQTIQYLTRDTEDENFTYQVDFKGEVEFGPIVNIAMGAKVVSRERNGEGITFYADPDIVANVDGADVRLGDITLADYGTAFPADDYLTRVVGSQLNGWTIPDFENVYSTFLPNALSTISRDGGTLTELLDDEEPTTTSFDSQAIYLMADYELFDGRLLGDFGVRWVKTESLARGRAGFNFTNWDPEGDVDENGTILGGAFNAGNFSITDVVFGDIEYTNALPSFNARYTLSDDMLLRFSVAKAMSRPKPSRLVPGYVITARNGNAPSAAGGNPDLQPTEVIQYDLSWEWYFDDTAMVSAAMFYKDFQSLTYTQTIARGFSDNECASADEFPAEQQQYRDLHCAQILGDVDTKTLVNGDGGEIVGLETSYQQDFTFLPGWAKHFGTVINYTYADSKATFVSAEEDAGTADLLDGFPMLNTSKHVFNGTLYWENQGFSARIAYNYRSKRLTNPSSFDGALWTDARDTVDFSASYKVSKALSVNFAATNLTDTYNRIFITRLQEEPDNGIFSEGNALDGGAPDWRTYIADHNGRNFRVGLTYKF